MKIKIGIGVALVAILTIIGIELEEFNKFKLNKIYSEKNIENYEVEDDIEEKNYLNREQAIQKALDYIFEIFNVKLDKDDVTEYVSLGNDETRLIWNIEIRNNNEKNVYMVDIYSDTGEIIFAYEINSNNNNDIYEKEVYLINNEKESEKYLKEASKIIKPITDKFEEFDIKKDLRGIYSDGDKHLEIYFYYKKTSVEFRIDLEKKKIIRYRYLI